MSEAVLLTWNPTPGTTSSVLRNGVVIASGLTTGTYTDTDVTPGQTDIYTVTATDADGTSQPSNVVTLSIPAPPPVLVGTMMGYGTATINQNLTRVTVNVSAVSGKAVPTGTVTWAIGGQTIFTDTLLKNGRDAQNVWTVLLNSKIPITITYSGSANFAASSATLP